jgi:hypothetical protein
MIEPSPSKKPRIKCHFKESDNFSGGCRVNDFCFVQPLSIKSLTVF